ncbi:MAG: helix-turn-helix domain-containing protein [Bacillota bacterium]
MNLDLINERYAKLLYYLFHENDWCTLHYLSEKTNYPKSTIWRLLSILEDELPPGWVIKKSEINGFRLFKPQNGTLESVWIYLKEKNSFFQILDLIALHNGVSVNEITEKAHVSRATVYRQIKLMKEIVEPIGIQITNTPFKLGGDEKQIRKFIMQYLELIGKNMEAPYIETFHIEDFKTTLFRELTEPSITLHMGAVHRLATIIDISNLRISYGSYVSLPDYVMREFIDSEVFKAAKAMFQFMKKCPTREIQLQELLYFTLHLENEKMPKSRTQEIIEIRSRLKENKRNSSKFYNQFLHDLSNYVGYDISQDDSLLYSLAQTLRRIYFDFQLGTDTRMNRMLPFITFLESNPLFLTITKIIEDSILHIKDSIKHIEKVEILEIFLLISAAILRKKKQFKLETVLICRTYIEGEFIKEVLSTHLGNHLSITVLDYSGLEFLRKENKFDLVLTTIETKLYINHLPVYSISSIPSPVELNELKQIIDQTFNNLLKIDPEILYPFK